VGRALLEGAEHWVSEAGLGGLAIETQNINVPACRLYARRGYDLVAIQRFAYAGLPNEVRLIWHKQLDP
jgi:GNAT superfamily N-acetyltransferase